MTAQPNLFPPPPADGNLTEDQAFVYALLQTNPEGMRAFDIGRALHLDGRYQCRPCNEQRTCDFAQPHALRVLGQLGTSGRQLVIRRRSGLWQSLVRSAVRDSGEIPY